MTPSIHPPKVRRPAGPALLALLSGLVLFSVASPAANEDHITPRHFENPAQAAFTNYALQPALDREEARLTVTGTVTLRHLPGVPANRKVPFLLHRDLTIEDIRLNRATLRTLGEATGEALRWEAFDAWEPTDFWAIPKYPELDGLDHARQVDLWIDPAAGLASWPEEITFDIEYSGVVYDSLRPPRENYQRGFETTRGLIDPRGAFLSSATLWYPNRFDEPFTFQLAVNCPTDWMAVTQGRLTMARQAAGRYWWTCPQPMDDIYLVAGPYQLREEQHGDIAIQTFTYGHDDEELCRRYIDATREYLDLYEELIGDYAFDKFALVENFWQTGYGMPSFTLLGDRVVRLPFIVRTSYGHEILHNWWGNGVFVDYESGNWCEGLTVYGADYLYKERESQEAARDYRRNQLQEYLNYVRDGRDFPLTDFRSRHDASSAAVGYGKAMMIYHMLRQNLGDEAFWNSLNQFYEEFLFRQASWDDILEVFAQNGALGMDLEAFYEQWISRSGAPSLTLAKADLVYDDRGGGGRGRGDAGGGGADLSFQIDQTAPYYELSVPMRVTFADREPETWFVQIEGAHTTGQRRLPGRPLMLEVDPDFDLFRRLHRAEVPAALGQLFGADSATVVLASDAVVLASGTAAASEPGTVSDPGTSTAVTPASAFAEIAEQAKRAKPTLVTGDQDLVLADLRAGSAWIFGRPSWLARLATLFPGTLQVDGDEVTLQGERFDLRRHTLVCSFPNPAAPEEAIGWIAGGDGTEYAALWRKLPHYGKYSYLVFEGSQNVAKGSWQVEHSPMKVAWAGEE